LGLRIFVIDDEESIRDTFKWHLEDQGHEVMACDRPSTCTVFQDHDCQKERPCGHALFVDYYLPEINGLKFIEMMEKRGCKGATRNKILMSGDTTTIDEEKARDLGCRIIQKPITLDEVDAIIEEIERSFSPDEMTNIQ